METCSSYLRRSLLVAACAVLTSVSSAPTFFAQSGGGYVIHPSVVPSGGGASSNTGMRIEGSIGQNVLRNSTATPFTVRAGFWPNAVPCPFGVSPRAQFFTIAGGTGSVNVIAPGFCSWTASASDSWITITSSDNGTGIDMVTFEARENFTGSARQALITVSGLSQIVVQDGGLGDDCNYSVNPSFRSFSATGGSGIANVVAEERCAWQAVSSDSWITITSIGVGVGSGSVTYAVESNTGPGRNGSLIVAGKIMSVKQKGR
jgi:hypothetical protein